MSGLDPLAQWFVLMGFAVAGMVMGFLIGRDSK